MPIRDLGSLPSDNSDGAVIPIERHGLDTASRSVPDEIAGDAVALAQIAREQLARDIAEIERATAALRKAEPALESWTNTPATTVNASRPVWLLIGALWLSTALVTLVAVVAIAALVG